MYKSRIFFRNIWLSKMKIFKRLFRRAFIICVIFIIIYFTYYFIDFKMFASVKAVSGIKATSIATDIINQAILQEFGGSGQADNLINIERDAEGNIAMLSSNTAKINAMNSAIATAVIKRFDSMKAQTIDIPFGMLINCDSFSGYGRCIKLKILPAGSVKTDFKSDLTQAGINQTRYRLYISVSCIMRVVAPLMNESIEVCTSVPVIDTVIIGRVPGVYAGIGADK